MAQFTLQELASLEAVVAEGSFQAAAARLGRTHPSVHAAVGSLERQLGVALLDRSQYRVALTEDGRALMARVRKVLDAAALLEQDAAHLKSGEEPELSIVVGDLCPLPRTLALIAEFFKRCPKTRLNLHYGAISGPWESLIDNSAQLAIHHVEKEELRIESTPLLRVRIVPVAAPALLPFSVHEGITPQQMAAFNQCILRDSALAWPERNYHVIPGAARCSAPDQLMKKQLILSGFAWGHLPDFLIERELASGQLVSLVGQYFPVHQIEICAARRAHENHGPVAQRLWDFLRDFSRSETDADGAPRTLP